MSANTNISLLNPPGKPEYASLKVIPAPQQYLQVQLVEGSQGIKNSNLPPRRQYPLQESETKLCKIISANRLTSKKSDKTVLKLKLEYNEKISPGNTLGIVCPSSEEDIAILVQRLDLKEKLECSCRFSLISGLNKKHNIPSHLNDGHSLHDVLKWQVDLRAPVKKQWLRGLAEYASNEEEKQRLKELSSRQGSEEYNQLVLEMGLNLLDVLLWFPSVDVPLSRILEWLPALQPRPYSVASSFLNDSETVDVVFRVIDFPLEKTRYYSRSGVCTGWLQKLTNELISRDDNVVEAMKVLTLDTLPLQVFCYARKGGNFVLPEDRSVPLVLVAHGTGVAPFRAFLQHREALVKTDPQTELGPVWLFYGCRRPDEDFLFKNELMEWLNMGILTRIITAYSRVEAPEECTYVQEKLKENGKGIVDFVDDCRIYVCGDSRRMISSVYQTFIQIYQHNKDSTPNEAEAFFKKKKEDSTYLEDNWL